MRKFRLGLYSKEYGSMNHPFLLFLTQNIDIVNNDFNNVTLSNTNLNEGDTLTITTNSNLPVFKFILSLIDASVDNNDFSTKPNPLTINNSTKC